MRPMKLIIALVFGALTLSACAGEAPPQLMNLRSGTNGPDEFGILPVKPLEIPDDVASLPDPTPGGANRVDLTPQADAIAALGGKAGSGAADDFLVRYASRAGVSPDIRATLSAEDLQFRRANKGLLLERLFKNTIYFKAYRRQSLDQQAELARWRARGLPTPSAPPAK